MRAETTISFVIPVLNDALRLRNCLASIAANGPGIDVVVVDNGSSDGSDRVALDVDATLLRIPGVSVAALRNAGAAASAGDILAFVDADHVIAPGWASAARLALTVEHAAAVGTTYRTEGRTWVQRAYDGLRSRRSEPRPVSWLGSGNLAVRRQAFVEVAGFDEGLRTCEDVDFCRRLRAVGGIIIDDPALVSVHIGDPATLRAVFLGELWRGRDNLVVSFRPPLDPRGIITALLPVTVLSFAVLAMLAAVLGAQGFAVLAACGTMAPVVPRTIQLCTNLRRWSLSAVLQAALVGGAYEAGRALGVVARARHSTRRDAQACAGAAQP